MRVSPVPASLLLVWGLTACSENAPGVEPLDAGARRGDAGTVDGGAATDAGETLDASDGSSALGDAGDALDAGDTLDAGDASDAASNDAGPGDDAGLTDDAGLAVGDGGAMDASMPGPCVELPWGTDHVGNAGNWGGSTAIAVAPDGVPHVVFHRGRHPASYSARELMIAAPDAEGRWIPVPIVMGTGNDRNDTTDLGFDAEGTPWVVFPAIGDGTGLHPSALAHETSAGWLVETLGAGNTYASLAIDAAGTVHVAQGETLLQYAQRTRAGLGAIEARGDARCMSIGVERDGTAHVAYATTPRGADTELHHAVRTTEGAWSDERVDGLGAALGYACETSIDVGPDGTVHIVYTTALAGLMHASLPRGGRWSIEGVPGGGYPSMDVDAEGGVHVASGGGAALFYAYLAPGAAAWVGEPVTVPGRIVPGADTSIAVGPDQVVHIASYDESAAAGPGYAVHHSYGRICPR